MCACVLLIWLACERCSMQIYTFRSIYNWIQCCYASNHNCSHKLSKSWLHICVIKLNTWHSNEYDPSRFIDSAQKNSNSVKTRIRIWANIFERLFQHKITMLSIHIFIQNIYGLFWCFKNNKRVGKKHNICLIRKPHEICERNNNNMNMRN